MWNCSGSDRAKKTSSANSCCLQLSAAPPRWSSASVRHSSLEQRCLNIPPLHVGQEDGGVTESNEILRRPEQNYRARCNRAASPRLFVLNKTPPKHLTNPVSPHGQGQLFNKEDINHHRLHISPRCYRRARSAVAFCIITR